MKKAEAIQLRKKGFSYTDIAEKLNVSRSGAAKWVKDIRLTKRQKSILEQKTREKIEGSGRPRKTERNKLIVQLVNQGKTYQEVANILGLKGRGYICEIYHRDCSEKLSTV